MLPALPNPRVEGSVRESVGRGGIGNNVHTRKHFSIFYGIRYCVISVLLSNPCNRFMVIIFKQKGHTIYVLAGGWHRYWTFSPITGYSPRPLYMNKVYSRRVHSRGRQRSQSMHQPL